MKYLFIGISSGIFTLFIDYGWCRETKQSSWYPIIILKYGVDYGGTSGDFFDTYNNSNSFPRPSLISESQWQNFDAPERHSSLGAEIGVKLRDKISFGIAGQRYSFNEADNLTYTSIIQFSNGETVPFPNITEEHEFKSTVTHVLAFFDYRIFAPSSLSHVIGLGLGFTFSSFEWNWNIEGRTVIEDIFFRLSEDQTFTEIDKHRNFAVQPRFRLEYRFEGGGFFHALFLQTDYIFSKYEADYFEDFRNFALGGAPFESLPVEFQTDAIRKIYDQYDVDAGGFQVMLGLTLKFDVPEKGAEKEK